MAITVPYKVDVVPLLDAVDDDVKAIGAANYLTIEDGRMIDHNNTPQDALDDFNSCAYFRTTPLLR